MVLANDERAEWRENMSDGNIPERVERSIQLYRKLSKDPCWRSSRFIESLGEAAVLWYDSLEHNKVNKNVS